MILSDYFGTSRGDGVFEFSKSNMTLFLGRTENYRQPRKHVSDPAGIRQEWTELENFHQLS